MAATPTRNTLSLQASGIPNQALTAAAASLVLATGPCQFFSATCVANASVAGWFLIYDAATVPADGAGQKPFSAIPVSAGGVVSASVCLFGHPCQNGCVLVFSTTGPFTQTTTGGNAQFLSGQVA